MNQDEWNGLTNAQEWTSKGLNIMMRTLNLPNDYLWINVEFREAKNRER